MLIESDRSQCFILQLSNTCQIDTVTVPAAASNTNSQLTIDVIGFRITEMFNSKTTSVDNVVRRIRSCILVIPPVINVRHHPIRPCPLPIMVIRGIGSKRQRKGSVAYFKRTVDLIQFNVSIDKELLFDLKSVTVQVFQRTRCGERELQILKIRIDVSILITEIKYLPVAVRFYLPIREVNLIKLNATFKLIRQEMSQRGWDLLGSRAMRD